MQGKLGRDVYCLLGLPFDATNMAGAVQRVRDAVADRARCFISTPNLNWLVNCRKDPQFRDSVLMSDLSVADGMPLIWIAWFLGIPISERVAGAGLFEQLKKNDRNALSVYFFGGPDGVAEAAARRLNEERGGLVCVGFESPGSGSVEELSRSDSIARINASGADLLVVSLGAKKGQAWIERNRSRISVPAISHLGAVVNFAAGTVRRAPAWVQRAGLEWMWRIKEEPALSRRYLADGIEFLKLLMTRVLPFAWSVRWHRPSPSEMSSASVQVVEGSGDARVRLRGAWCSENLPALRESLSALTVRKLRIRINLEAVSYVDSAFLGLLMLVYGTQKQNGRRLTCESATANLRKVFGYACCEFLLEDVDPIPGEGREAAELALEDGEEALRG